MVALATVHRELRVLLHVLRKAEEDEYISHNPVPRFKLEREYNERDRFLSKEEYRLLMIHSNDHLRDIIIFSVNTGMRPSELFKLQFREVDWEGPFIRIPGEKKRTKTSKGRSIPIFPPTLRILDRKKQERKPGQSRVFLYKDQPIKSVKTTFATTCRWAGLNDLWFYDLRRTFVNWMAMEGWQERQVMAITGHGSEKAFAHYRHVFERELLMPRKPIPDGATFPGFPPEEEPIRE